MYRRALAIGRWGVEFLVADAGGYDIPEVVDTLAGAHAPDGVVEEATALMEGCSADCGFTYTNAFRRRAVVLVGPTSSGAEFIDTLVHELHHLAVAIAADLGVDLEGESPAYLAGDAARELADVVCLMGCPCCRGGLRRG